MKETEVIMEALCGGVWGTMRVSKFPPGAKETYIVSMSYGHGAYQAFVHFCDGILTFSFDHYLMHFTKEFDLSNPKFDFDNARLLLHSGVVETIEKACEWHFFEEQKTLTEFMQEEHKRAAQTQ
jgi:hypothetical protein